MLYLLANYLKFSRLRIGVLLVVKRSCRQALKIVEKSFSKFVDLV